MTVYSSGTIRNRIRNGIRNHNISEPFPACSPHDQPLEKWLEDEIVDIDNIFNFAREVAESGHIYRQDVKKLFDQACDKFQKYGKNDIRLPVLMALKNYLKARNWKAHEIIEDCLPHNYEKPRDKAFYFCTAGKIEDKINPENRAQIQYAYQTAIQKQKDYDHAWVQWAGLLHDCNDYGGALAKIVQALLIDRQNPETHHLEGIIHVDNRDFEDAETSFGKAAIHDPFNPFNYLELAGICNVTERPDQAVPYYHRTLEHGISQFPGIKQKICYSLAKYYNDKSRFGNQSLLQESARYCAAQAIKLQDALEKNNEEEKLSNPELCLMETISGISYRSGP